MDIKGIKENSLDALYEERSFVQRIRSTTKPKLPFRSRGSTSFTNRVREEEKSKPYLPRSKQHNKVELNGRSRR